jgi:hypothetical protein
MIYSPRARPERNNMANIEDTESPPSDACALIQLWRQYGKRFGGFVPAHQPVPEIWDPDLPERGAKEKTNPQYLKHWKFFGRTREFLREYYARYQILQGPSLFFDCLVPHFQKKIQYVWAEDQYGQPGGFEVKDEYDWYHKAIRIGLFGGETGFSCRSIRCQRHWCALHRQNPHRINPVDVYGLVSLFEDISLTAAKNRVARWWGVKLGDLPSKGVPGTRRPRRQVPKKAIYDLLAQYGSGVRAQHVKALIRELCDLVKSCPFVEWHRRLFDEEHAFFSKELPRNLVKIGSPAVKAYLWLLIRQEELARDTRGPAFSVSDSELGEAIGVSKPTARSYRERLTQLGLVEVEEIEGLKKKGIVIRKVKY